MAMIFFFQFNMKTINWATSDSRPYISFERNSALSQLSVQSFILHFSYPLKQPSWTLAAGSSLTPHWGLGSQSELAESAFCA